MLKITQDQQEAEREAVKFAKKHKKDCFVAWCSGESFFLIEREPEYDFSLTLDKDDEIIFKAFGNGKTWAQPNFK